MPIYEYEPTEHDCLICSNRFEVIQGIDEPTLAYCPTCGMPCKRVVSRVSFKLAACVNPDKAAKKGLTTWRRADKGRWEKVAGPGVDVIEGRPEDIAAVESEKAKPKKVDLDSP